MTVQHNPLPNPHSPYKTHPHPYRHTLPSTDSHTQLTLHVRLLGARYCQVDATNIRVRPLLTYTATPPAGITTAANNALPDCDLSTLDAVSGVGECEVLLDGKFFPATGASTVNVTLQVLRG
jgi:hypothetical protein